MELEKPLHVQVAEALGWIGVAQVGSAEWAGFLGEIPGRVSRYDTDWSVTGPLIEKYGISLQPEYFMTDPPKLTGYRAIQALTGTVGYGVTALEAVCNLILALAAAGKLKAA